MKIKAQFIGTDSLGYEHGKVYKMHFGFMQNVETKKSRVYIQRIDRTGTCPYDSLRSFLDNWKVL